MPRLSLRGLRFVVSPARLCAALALILGAVIAPGLASAAPTVWDTGDVFVGIGNGQYSVYTNAGVFKETINTGFPGRETTGCAFNNARDRLYTTVFGGPVVVFDNAVPHNVVQTIDTSTTGAADNESIVFAANGDFYVGHADGNHQITRYNSAGVFQQAYSPTTGPRGTDWIDLAADQHTMFFDSEGPTTYRFDVAGAGSQLPNFANTGPEAFALRLLPPFDGSGGALIADGSRVVRVDGSGAIVQTYSFPGGASLLFALNLDPNGTSFWTGDIFGAKFARLNIATGATEVGPILTGQREVAGLCVKGEITGGSPPPANNRSLALNGTTAYADVPDAASLNIITDWTLETWFRDENPNGFNHDYVTLINKGDRSAGNGGESPYFITLGFKRLVAGLRSNFVDYSIYYDLRAGGVDPTKWHHVAASFQASTRTLTLYLDGAAVASGTLGSLSAGNNLPVQLGRNGPVSGKNFMGKLDDTRIWNVVRSGADIKANFGSELSTAPAGLVANWKYDDPDGTTAADSADSHDATLHGGAVFSNDVHP
jgi:Concanavalin A-like lectin/glucanases superfamily